MPPTGWPSDVTASGAAPAPTAGGRRATRPPLPKAEPPPPPDRPTPRGRPRTDARPGARPRAPPRETPPEGGIRPRPESESQPPREAPGQGGSARSSHHGQPGLAPRPPQGRTPSRLPPPPGPVLLSG